MAHICADALLVTANFLQIKHTADDEEFAPPRIKTSHAQRSSIVPVGWSWLG